MGRDEGRTWTGSGSRNGQRDAIVSLVCRLPFLYIHVAALPLCHAYTNLGNPRKETDDKTRIPGIAGRAARGRDETASGSLPRCMKAERTSLGVLGDGDGRGRRGRRASSVC